MAGGVIVGVDGSKGSRAALRWAFELATLTGRRLRAVRAWRYPSSVALNVLSEPPINPRAVDLAIEEGLREIAFEELGAAGDRVLVSSLRGDSAGALLANARRTQAYLLVVGSRGLGGFRGLLLGSVGRTVVQHAPCPVAVVRGSMPVGRRATLLVAVDASPGASAALAWAASLAHALRSQIFAVHALDVPMAGSTTRARMRSEAVLELEGPWTSVLRDEGVPYRCAVLDGDPRQVLLDVTERERPSLVVVAARAGHRLSHIQLGRVPTLLAQHVPGVLVVVPPPAAEPSP